MKSIKPIIFSMITILAITFGLSAPASATCLSGCLPQPSPAPTVSGFSVEGNAWNNGEAGAVFAGQQGGSGVNQTGFSKGVVALGADGNICGPTCQSGGFSVDLSAGQLSTSAGWAASAAPNTPAMVSGFSNANVGVGFSTSKTMSAPAGH